MLTVSSLKNGDLSEAAVSQFSEISQVKSRMMKILETAEFQNLNYSAVSELLRKSYSNPTGLQVNLILHKLIKSLIVITWYLSNILRIYYNFQDRKNFYFTLRDVWHGFLTKVGRESSADFSKLIELSSV